MEGKGRDPLPLQVSAHKHTNHHGLANRSTFSLYQSNLNYIQTSCTKDHRAYIKLCKS